MLEHGKSSDWTTIFLIKNCISSNLAFVHHLLLSSLKPSISCPLPKGSRDIYFLPLFLNCCQNCQLGRCARSKIPHLSPGNTCRGVVITLHAPSQSSAMLCDSAPGNTKPDEHTLTDFSGDLGERLHTTLPIVAFGSQRWDVVPPQGCHNVNNGLCLVGVWWDHSREVVVPGVVAQFWSCRCIADLRYLQTEG